MARRAGNLDVFRALVCVEAVCELQRTGRAGERVRMYCRRRSEGRIGHSCSSMIIFFPPSSKVYFAHFFYFYFTIVLWPQLARRIYDLSFILVLVLYVAIALVFGVCQTRCGSTEMAWFLDNAASTMRFLKTLFLTAAPTS